MPTGLHSFATNKCSGQRSASPETVRCGTYLIINISFQLYKNFCGFKFFCHSCKYFLRTDYIYSFYTQKNVEIRMVLRYNVRERAG